MSQTITAAEQHKNLIAQENGLLTTKARLLEQLEATNARLTEIRAALEGAKIGFGVAQEAAEKASTADTAPKAE